jgi:hypothetical protein
MEIVMKKSKNTDIRQLKVEPGKPDAFIFDPSELGSALASTRAVV